MILTKYDAMIYIYRDSKSLTTTSEELVKNNVWSNCEIIDSQGYLYEILDVKTVGSTGLWGWNPLIKGRGVRVAFNFSPAQHLALDEIKQRITQHINVRTSSFV